MEPNTININIFFLSNGLSILNGGSEKEKISRLKVKTEKINYKLHQLLNPICCAKNLNPPKRRIPKNNFYLFKKIKT